jgi:hypothetical protein
MVTLGTSLAADGPNLRGVRHGEPMGAVDLVQLAPRMSFNSLAAIANFLGFSSKTEVTVRRHNSWCTTE